MKNFVANKANQSIIVLVAACIIIYLISGYPFLPWLAVALVVVSILSGKIKGYIHAFWMKFGSIIGFITGKIMLTVIYFLLVLPIGILFRKKLSITLKRQSDTYYKSRNHLYIRQDLEKVW